MSDTKNFYTQAMKCPYVQKVSSKCPFISKQVDACPFLSSEKKKNEHVHNIDNIDNNEEKHENKMETSTPKFDEEEEGKLQPLTSMVNEQGLLVPNIQQFYENGRNSHQN